MFGCCRRGNFYLCSHGNTFLTLIYFSRQTHKKLHNRKAYLKLKEKKEKNRKARHQWRRSAQFSVERVEEREPETPTSRSCSNFITPTQLRFKINDHQNPSGVQAIMLYWVTHEQVTKLEYFGRCMLS